MTNLEFLTALMAASPVIAIGAIVLAARFSSDEERRENAQEVLRILFPGGFYE